MHSVERWQCNLAVYVERGWSVSMELAITPTAATSSLASSLTAQLGSYPSGDYLDEYEQWNSGDMAFANSLSYALENSMKIWQVCCTR